MRTIRRYRLKSKQKLPLFNNLVTITSSPRRLDPNAQMRCTRRGDPSVEKISQANLREPATLALRAAALTRGERSHEVLTVFLPCYCTCGGRTKATQRRTTNVQTNPKTMEPGCDLAQRQDRSAACSCCADSFLLCCLIHPRHRCKGSEPHQCRGPAR